MPRPKTVTDRAVLEHAFEIMQDRGPAGVTFSAVAAAAGLSPATLVQRFASKELLVEATLVHAWDQLDERTAVADVEAAVSAEGAIKLLASLSAFGGPDRYANGLLILREDVSNPTLRARGKAWRKALIKALGRRLTGYAGTEDQLGRQMANAWQGAILWCAFAEASQIEKTVARELTSFIGLLAPNRGGAATVRKRPGIHGQRDPDRGH